MNIYPNNDMLVKVTGLVGPDGSIVAAATLSATLTDHAGVAVPGVSPITLTAVAGQPGNYSGQLPAADLTPYKSYRLTIAGTGDNASLSVVLALSSVPRTF